MPLSIVVNKTGAQLDPIRCILRRGLPRPAHTRAAISQPTEGAAAEIEAKVQFMAREMRRHLRLPRRSAALPATIPPTSIPTNTAAVRSSSGPRETAPGSHRQVRYTISLGGESLWRCRGVFYDIRAPPITRTIMFLRWLSTSTCTRPTRTVVAACLSGCC